MRIGVYIRIFFKKSIYEYIYIYIYLLWFDLKFNFFFSIYTVYIDNTIIKHYNSIYLGETSFKIVELNIISVRLRNICDLDNTQEKFLIEKYIKKIYLFVSSCSICKIFSLINQSNNLIVKSLIRIGYILNILYKILSIRR